MYSGSTICSEGHPPKRCTKCLNTRRSHWESGGIPAGSIANNKPIKKSGPEKKNMAAMCSSTMPLSYHSQAKEVVRSFTLELRIAGELHLRPFLVLAPQRGALDGFPVGLPYLNQPEPPMPGCSGPIMGPSYAVAVSDAKPCGLTRTALESIRPIFSQEACDAAFCDVVCDETSQFRGTHHVRMHYPLM